MKKIDYASLTESDLRALQILIAQPDLVRPGYFGSLLWPNSEKRGGNCSAPLARSAGKVLNRLRAADCAEWVHLRRDHFGWRVTLVGRSIHNKQRARAKRHPGMYR